MLYTCAMPRGYWLMKSEPDAFSWSDLVRDGSTLWDGVRNYQARNHLRSMRAGDHALLYHSISDKAVVGIMEVRAEAQPDPTALSGDWSVVTVVPLRPLKAPVTLASLKSDPALADLPLIRQNRLSVMPLTPDHYRHILSLGGLGDMRDATD